MFIPNEEHIGNILYEFHNGVNASAVAKCMQCAYGVDALSVRRF